MVDGDAKVNKLLHEKQSVVVHFRVQTAQEALIHEVVARMKVRRLQRIHSSCFVQLKWRMCC